ncbi:MAG TPA: hypothetical protein VH331_16540 [Allosphingosinicella sp.]|nr:hypothetical protein [Allosphingosinicella sp.]
MPKTIRTMALVSAVPALIASSAVAAPPEPVAHRHGLKCGKPSTYSIGGLGAPTASASPLDPAAERLIDALAKAAASRTDAAALVDETQVPARTQSSCLAALARLIASSRCSNAPLFRQGDGTIRQEWLCGGRVGYILYYTVERGKTGNIWADDGDGPVIYALPAR